MDVMQTVKRNLLRRKKYRERRAKLLLKYGSENALKKRIRIAINKKIRRPNDAPITDVMKIERSDDSDSDDDGDVEHILENAINKRLESKEIVVENNDEHIMDNAVNKVVERKKFKKNHNGKHTVGDAIAKHLESKKIKESNDDGEHVVDNAINKDLESKKIKKNKNDKHPDGAITKDLESKKTKEKNNDKHVGDAITKDLKNKKIKENEKDKHMVPSTSTRTSSVTDQNSTIEKKKRKRSKISDLPLSRVRTIMKSTPDVENIGFTALFAVAKVTELFIQNLALEALKVRKCQKLISYNDLANTVLENDNLRFLREIMPKKITMAEYYKILAKNEEELKNNDDDPQMSDSSLTPTKPSNDD